MLAGGTVANNPGSLSLHDDSFSTRILIVWLSGVQQSVQNGRGNSLVSEHCTPIGVALLEVRIDDTALVHTGLRRAEKKIVAPIGSRGR